jgi:hypothetical protein
MDRKKQAFFKAMERINGESRERKMSDIEHRKRWLLKSMSGGFGRNQGTRPKTVTLPKLSILEDK